MTAASHARRHLRHLLDGAHEQDRDDEERPRQRDLARDEGVVQRAAGPGDGAVARL
jgi:hypothetical protein